MIAKCSMCNHEEQLEVTPEQIHAWKNGALIQDVMPKLTPSQREMLISQICGNCFDKLFDGDEG